MIKIEALQAMKDGKKITHVFYTPYEFIQMDKQGIITDEQGIVLGSETDEFWNRIQEWPNGWNLFDEPKSEVETTDPNYELWAYLNKEHGLILLGSELDEIINRCRLIIKELDRQDPDFTDEEFLLIEQY